MSDKNFTTKTASLKATAADIYNLDAIQIDAKKLSLNGKNILDYISNSDFTSFDTRDPQLKNDELDIWNAEISISDNGCIEVKPHVHGVYVEDTAQDTYYTYEGMTASQANTIKTAVKVVDNEVLGADDAHIMYWQTGGLISGDQMFYRTSLTSFSSDLSSLTNGELMFYKSALTSWNIDLPSLTNGYYMFRDTALTSWDIDLPNLIYGRDMFSLCENLTSFSGDLSSLTDGLLMFYNTALESFNGDLSSLTDGSWMFQYCSELKTFNGDLSSLTNGYYMFYGTALTSWNIDLPSLTNGTCMFYKSALTSFNGDLSSLTWGEYMFSDCKLNAESIHNILHTIKPNTSSKTITIGTNIINDSTTLEAQKLEFAKTCLCDSWDELNAEFTAKHWTVTWQFNGEAASSASTLALTDSNISTALWAKLEEVTEENAPYKYVSEEDGKHYNISWFHETNGSTEGYEYFGSLLEACGAFGVIPKEYAESNN